MIEPRCKYISPDGLPCTESAEYDGRCYWHNSDQVKDRTDLKDKLETRAKTNLPMQGVSLRRTDLSDINLVNHGCKQGYDLSYSDFYRANMQKAHLFNANLQHASLMKADLRGANLHCANLEDANLLGTRLEDARLDNIQWGHYVLQEKMAHASKDLADRQDYLEQAEEVYRNLRRVLEHEGLFEQAGYFFRREMVMRRLQMPYYSMSRFVSRTVDLFCGYGERPLRIIFFSVFLILAFAVAYFLNGVNDGGNLVKFSSDLPVLQNIENFLNALYFSVVTFTTLGFGDITPNGWSRLFAGGEAFIGSFTLALFVVVFVKKMTR
ncbi:MAG: potassium transporter Kef [Oceanospirillum sp.]|nr:potassium transporter Kef [Oceanospirillum sp.]